MPLYSCECCKYYSSIKTHYNKHLKTNKHLRHIKQYNNSGHCSLVENDEMKMTQNEPKMNQNEPKMNQMNQENIKDSQKKFQCQYCSELFLTKPSMRRHELHRCKNNSNAPMSVYEQLKKEKREKRKLYKQIEKLLEENGKALTNVNCNNSINSHNTTNNNTTNNIQQNNNIVINNYGDEDLSHITNSVLENLIKAPGDMINNLTKMIHFNVDKPENMNMYIPSRKQKYIKVFKQNQWMLEKKHERIPDLVDRNYNIIDTYYEDCGGSEQLNKQKNKNYKNYQKLIDEKNDKIIKLEYDACELEILNNSDLVIDKHNIQ